MRQFILDAPKQLLEAHHATAGVSLRQAASATLLGMGGSALSAGLVELLMARQQRRFTWNVVRNYTPPPQPCDLTLALSYSGNTEETIAAATQAASTPTQMVTVSQGGTLAQLADRWGCTHITVPTKAEGFQPRFALPFMFGVVKTLLEKSGLLEEGESLPSLASWLETLDLEAQGAQLGSWIGQRMPALYTCPDYEAGVARTWRIKFNENSKLACLWGSIPEMNHNEMMAFHPTDAGRFAVLLMPDLQDAPEIVRRFPLTATLLQESGFDVKVVPMSGETPLRKALASLMLADWVTYYTALARNVDPISIPAIQQFKKKLELASTTPDAAQ